MILDPRNMKRILLCILAMMALAFEGLAQNDAEALDRVISSRRSIRKYTEQKVSREVLDRIISNGLKAPSGMNRQSYEIRIVDDPALLEAISKTAGNGKKSIFADAKTVIFIANDTAYDFSQVDCGLLAQNIMLSAKSLGLGTCCMGAPVRQMKSSKECEPYLGKLGFSKGFDLLISIPIGYPAEQPAPRPRKDNMVKYIIQ